MENIYTIITLSAGLLLRIGVPVIITLSLVYFFTRLDARWQAESERLRRAEVKRLLIRAPETMCFNINNCPKMVRANCKAYATPEIPCWQVFRNQEGLLQEKCLGCRAFKEAPVPDFA
jgi:hypothetical protein